LLLDDELPGLTYLKMLCEQLPEIEVVKAFNNPSLFIEESKKLDYDFCIIDIEMPEINGLQIANLLNGKPLIFATAYNEYALEAFDLNAFDYIRKPIKIERLNQAIEKVKKYISLSTTVTNKKYFQVNSNKGKILLFFDKIAFIETSTLDSRDKIVHFFDKEEFVLKNITFDKLVSVLPSNDFCRINKKELISIKTIKTFTLDEITSTILNKQGQFIKFYISEVYKKEFLLKVKI